MKASIHISTYAIKVIAYTKTGSSIFVKAYHTHPLPDECVINGVIIDAAPIIEGLNSLKSAHPQLLKDVSLVLDGSFVYTKKITVPGKLTTRMYDRVVRDEFSEVSSDIENLICDHFPLVANSDGSKQILACGVENANVQTYLTIFNAAGIKLSSVRLGVATLLRFIKNRPDLSSLPFVLSTVDNEIMLSMIFQDGVNVFQSRSRLYGDDRSTLVTSTLDSLSGIIQFNKSQNFSDITNCFYLGLGTSDLGFITQNNQYPEITFGLLDLYKDARGAELLPPDAHYAYLNAVMPDNEPDLLKSIKILGKVKQQERPKKVLLPIAICLGVLIAGALGYLYTQVYVVEREVRDLKSFLSDPVIVAENLEIEALLADTSRIHGIKNAVAEKKEYNASRPQLSRALLDTIRRAGGLKVSVTGLSFQEDETAISVSAASSTEYDAANYVESLKADALIETVYYSGFNTSTLGEFVFTIDVIAAGWREEATS